MKETIIKLIVVIICVLLIIAMIIGSIERNKRQEKEYNNGVCFCGGKYHLIGVYGRMPTFVYECDKCQHTFCTNKLMD